VLALAFVGFVAFGVTLVLVGANQAALAESLALDLSASGLLAASLSLGIGAGVLVSGPLVDGWRRRPLFLASSAGATAALLAVRPEIGFGGVFACLAALGFALGFYETLLNTVVVERHAPHTARPLTFVHSGATLGAMLGAPALAWLAARAGWPATFQATAAAFAALTAAGFALRLEAAPRAGAGPDAGEAPGRVSLAIVPYAGVAACYVGVETAVTIFATPYARALGIGEARGVGAISAFWLGLLVGRLGFLGWRGAVDARLLVVSGLASSALLAAGVGLGVRSLALLVGGVGALLGFVFPVFVALTTQRFPNARGTATGIVTGAGAAGGFAVPWISGAIGDRFGVAMAFASLAAWCFALALCALAARRPRA
jgi:MFS family permease